MFCAEGTLSMPVLLFVVVCAVGFTLAATRILQLEGTVRQLRSAQHSKQWALMKKPVLDEIVPALMQK